MYFGLYRNFLKTMFSKYLCLLWFSEELNGVEDTPATEVVENVENEQELKYWKAVNDNPTDFTSWTYLLQFVEQEVCCKDSKISFSLQWNQGEIPLEFLFVL